MASPTGGEQGQRVQQCKQCGVGWPWAHFEPNEDGSRDVSRSLLIVLGGEDEGEGGHEASFEGRSKRRRRKCTAPEPSDVLLRGQGILLILSVCAGGLYSLYRPRRRRAEMAAGAVCHGMLYFLPLDRQLPTLRGQADDHFRVPAWYDIRADLLTI